MDVEKYYKELQAEGHSFEKCQLHYCCEWDELPLCKCSYEVKAGYCYCDFTNEKENP